MKNMLVVMFMLTSLVQYGQNEASMDKFIRIVGLAEKTLESDGMKIDFTLSEIEGNEYQKIRPKAIEEVKSGFIKSLQSMGIDPSKVVEDKIKNITKSKYGKVKTEHYSMEVKNEDEALTISKLELDGFKISSVDYIFTSTYDEYLDEMTIKAIEDAKRKATNIAKSVGKSVGQILNIEDLKNAKSTNSSRYGSKSKTKTLSYRVNVTFELN